MPEAICDLGKENAMNPTQAQEFRIFNTRPLWLLGVLLQKYSKFATGSSGEVDKTAAGRRMNIQMYAQG